MRKLSEAEWISRFEQVQGRKPKPDGTTISLSVWPYWNLEKL